MKNVLGVLITVALVSAFVGKDRSGIIGTIDPPEGAKKIYAVSGKDTVAIIPPPGSFILDVKPGTWKLVVEAVLPYKNAERENILVAEGNMTDIGLIKLEQ
jgi:hypothetical protein